MKKQWLLLCVMLSLNTASHANWLKEIRNSITVTNGLLKKQAGIETDMLTSQQDIEDLMRQVNGNVTGHSGWGNYQYHDYQSYGDSARSWSDVMHMADAGKGSGELGQIIGDISGKYPYDRSAFNQGVSNTNTQNYYALKSQTVLTARAASQLDYNKIQDQIVYQEMLRQQIEKTKDIKAAMDLSNRIHLEGNLISLEILRQSALVNQQQAVTEQASVMSALSNAKFLTKE